MYLLLNMYNIAALSSESLMTIIALLQLEPVLHKLYYVVTFRNSYCMGEADKDSHHFSTYI